MKILILTNHFDPEEFRCNDIAYELARRGHEVKVLTGIPDYPKGKFHKGYSLLNKRVEKKNGVTIVRVPLIPRGKGGKIRMVMNYSSSLFFFMLHAFYQAIAHKYDCIYIHNTSPAFICLPAVLIKKIRKTPIILWTLDMWPESLVAGGIRNPKIYSAIDKIMKRIYKNVDHHHISSLGFREMLVTRGVENESIEYLPNWCDTAMDESHVNMKIPNLPVGFKIMFAGNLGEAQNLENVLKTALLLKEQKDIHWIFLGDGRKKEWMEKFISENGLEENVHLLGRFPIEMMPAFFKQADLMLVSLCDETCFNLTLPAKVQAYMSAGKPILAFLNGEGQEIISKANCGYAIEASDIEGLKNAVLQLSKMEQSKLEELGKNGRSFAEKEFNYIKLMDKIQQSIYQLTSHLAE